MLRWVVTLVLAFCLAAWIAFGVDLLFALFKGGKSGVAATVLHLAGKTSQFGVASWRAALARLAALLLITVGFGFLWRYFRMKKTKI
jgi:putative Mn2+ efflux pump MntP